MKRMACFAVVLIVASSTALAQRSSVDRKALAQEMNSITEWRPGVAFGDKLAALPGKTGFEILRDNWTKGASVDARKQMFKGFVFNDHPDTLRVLNLGATDSDIELQKWSFEYLKQIAFIDFNEEYATYPAWFAKYGNGKLDDVRRQNFDRFISEIAASKGSDRELNYRKLSRFSLRAHPMHSEAALGIVKDIFSSPNPSRDAARAGGALLNIAQPSQTFLREIVMPGLKSHSPELREVASQALAQSKSEWAYDALAATLRASFDVPNGMQDDSFMLGTAMGELNNPKAIPLLIGAISAENTYWSVYGLGYFGLLKLTGVSYDESHDGKWWVSWWENNKSRYPEAVRQIPIPSFHKA